MTKQIPNTTSTCTSTSTTKNKSIRNNGTGSCKRLRLSSLHSNTPNQQPSILSYFRKNNDSTTTTTTTEEKNWKSLDLISNYNSASCVSLRNILLTPPTPSISNEQCCYTPNSPISYTVINNTPLSVPSITTTTNAFHGEASSIYPIHCTKEMDISCNNNVSISTSPRKSMLTEQPNTNSFVSIHGSNTQNGCQNKVIEPSNCQCSPFDSLLIQQRNPTTPLRISRIASHDPTEGNGLIFHTPLAEQESSNDIFEHNKCDKTSTNNDMKLDRQDKPRIQHQTKKRQHQQLYLDFGQKDFAKPTVCPVCGMLYVHGVQDDAKRHDQICKQYKNGVSFRLHNKTSPSIRIVNNFIFNKSTNNQAMTIRRGSAIFATVPKRSKVETSSTPCVVEVRSTDDKYYLAKVCEVINIVSDELGYVSATGKFPDENTDQKSFLCIFENKVIGMILVERIKFAYHIKTSVRQQQEQQQHHTLGKTVSSSDTSNHYASTATVLIYESKKRAVEAILGIKLMWVHAKYRNHGIAKHLINTAREKMAYGIIIPINKIAFSSPTQAGLLFAVRYCNNDNDNYDDAVVTLSSSISSSSSSNQRYDVLDKNKNSSILVYDCV